MEAKTVKKRKPSTESDDENKNGKKKIKTEDQKKWKNKSGLNIFLSKQNGTWDADCWEEGDYKYNQLNGGKHGSFICEVKYASRREKNSLDNDNTTVLKHLASDFVGHIRTNNGNVCYLTQIYPNYVCEVIQKIHKLFFDFDIPVSAEEEAKIQEGFLKWIEKNKHRLNYPVDEKVFGQSKQEFDPSKNIDVAKALYFLENKIKVLEDTIEKCFDERPPGIILTSHKKNDDGTAKYGMHVIYETNSNVERTMKIRENVVKNLTFHIKERTEEQWRSIVDKDVYRLNGGSLRLPYQNKWKVCKNCLRLKKKNKKCCWKCEQCCKRIKEMEDCEDCGGGKDVPRSYKPLWSIDCKGNRTLVKELFGVESHYFDILKRSSILCPPKSTLSEGFNDINLFEGRIEDVKFVLGELKKEKQEDPADSCKEAQNVAKYIFNLMTQKIKQEYEFDEVQGNLIKLERTIEDTMCIVCERQHSSRGILISCGLDGSMNLLCSGSNNKFKLPMNISILPYKLFSMKNFPIYHIKFIWIYLNLNPKMDMANAHVLDMMMNNNIRIPMADDKTSLKLLWNEEKLKWVEVTYEVISEDAADVLEILMMKMNEWILPKIKKTELKIEQMKENCIKTEDKKELKKIKTEISKLESEPLMEIYLKMKSIIFRNGKTMKKIIKNFLGMSSVKMSNHQMDDNRNLFAIGEGKVIDFSLIEKSTSLKMSDFVRLRTKEDYITIENEVKFDPLASDTFVKKILNDTFLIVDITSTGIFDEAMNCTNLPANINSIILSYLSEVGMGGNEPTSFFKRPDIPIVYEDGTTDMDEWRNLIKKQMILNEQGYQSMKSLQDIFGYILTGNINVEKYWIFYNKLGRGGKGLMMEALQSIMGKYFATAEKDLFTDGGQKAGKSEINSFLMMLTKARIAWCDDIKSHLNQTLVKSVTGGTPIVARDVFEKGKSTNHQWKILICINTPPSSVNYDSAMWKRTQMLMFPAVFVDHEPHAIYHRISNSNLKENIKTDEFKSAFLNWVLEGTMKYYKNERKVETSYIVEDATLAYRASTDSYVKWTLCCLEKDEKSNLSIENAYDNYTKFCSNSQPRLLTCSNKDFSKKTQEDFPKGKRTSKKTIHLLGYKLRDVQLKSTKFIDRME
jgi:hypothetical protein